MWRLDSVAGTDGRSGVSKMRRESTPLASANPGDTFTLNISKKRRFVD
jgi:hypothetical protein